MLVALLFVAAAGPCGASLFLPDAPPPPLVVALPSDAEGLATRDAYAVPFSVEDDLFVVRYGPEGALLERDAERVLDAMRAAWRAEIVELAHPLVPTTDVYKLNVYVGDTGGNAPEGLGMGGYFGADVDGFPMMVVSRASLADDDDLRWVVAHELYHGVQIGLGTYPYDGESAWYWEATAEWAASLVLPENPQHGSFAGAFAARPDLGVSYFDYPDTGAQLELHQYGAFLLPRFLSEKAFDVDLVRASWLTSTPGADPLSTLTALAAARGADLAPVFADFAAANASWSYAYGALYRWRVDQTRALFPADDHGIAATLSLQESEAFTAPPSSLAPRRFGYNLLAFEAPRAGTFEVVVAGEPLGIRGSAARFEARAVVEGATSVLTPRGAELATTLVLAQGTQLLIVVASVPERAEEGETFPYRAAVRARD